MKMRGLFLLLAFSLSVFSPLSINIPRSDRYAYFVTLDVCHASDSAVSIDSDMTAIDECVGKALPLELAGFFEISDHRPVPDVMFFELDRPPKS